jgi:hypothetical protein
MMKWGITVLKAFCSEDGKCASPMSAHDRALGLFTRAYHGGDGIIAFV